MKLWDNCSNPLMVSLPGDSPPSSLLHSQGNLSKEQTWSNSFPA
jgi:hypothetical protein